MTVSALRLGVLSAGLLGAEVAHADQPRYRLQVVPSPTQLATFATEIRDDGLVVGTAQGFEPWGIGSASRPIIWDGSAMTTLQVPHGWSAGAAGGNDLGVVVGSSIGPWQFPQSTERRATIWRNGGFERLGTFGGPSSDATGVNNSGLVIGYADTINAGTCAFIYSEGAIAPIPGIGLQPSYAKDVNEDGIVLGSVHEQGLVRAWIHDSNTGSTSFVPRPPGTTHCMPYSINDRGDIVGQIRGPSEYVPFVFADGVTTLLDSSFGYVSDINNYRQIAGARFVPYEGYFAAIWEAGSIIDLSSAIDDPLQWRLDYARGINDAGQVIATGYATSGPTAFHTVSVLLTPIPEPLVLAPLVMTMLTRNRRRSS